MCEHSRRRYAARVVRSTGIPEPGMRQLPTNPLLAALPTRVGNRRISAGSTVDAASPPRRTMIALHHHHAHYTLDTSPVISTPEFSCERVSIYARDLGRRNT